MSDTPRTDAHNWNEGHYDDPLHSLLDFAKQLERELDAANESFRKLNIHALNLVDRIRRLEDAGDAMAEWLENPRNLGADACLSHAWREAKEAKL